MARPIDPNSAEQRILAALSSTGAMTTGEVAAALELPSKLTGSHLQNLFRRGLVRRQQVPSTTRHMGRGWVRKWRAKGGEA